MRDNLGQAARDPSSTDDALDELVALADQFLPNRAFPDKGVDLIEQSVAYAVTHGQTDRRRGRGAGRPSRPSSACRSTRRPRSTALATELRERALLDPRGRRALLGRLGVSLRGLDARRERPDAVVLLCDGRGRRRDAAGATLARHDLRPRDGR